MKEPEGCAPHILNYQWVRIGGYYVIGKGGYGVSVGQGGM